MGESLTWILIAFVSGSLPYSVWIGRLALKDDIRSYGDGNPGAFNVFRAGGKGWGWLAILLDGLKGAIPVGFAHYSAGLEGWPLVITALAPVIGHAYSPILKFRGGKAIAVTFGTWTGMTLWLAPTLLGISFAAVQLTRRNDRLAIVLGQAVLLIAFLVVRADWTWYAVWVGTGLVLLVKHLPKKRPA